MKNRLRSLLVLLLWIAGAVAVRAQGTAFTYQGRFIQNGVATNGVVEFQFTLWNADSGGTQVATATPPSSIVNVTNGLFTVPIDFGMTAFDGADRYLQIEARTTIGPFVTLTPRQKITAAPYALLAGKLSGTLTSSGLGGTYGNAVTFSNAANVFIGSGAGLTALNASQLSGAIPTAALSNAWKIGGNAGTTAGVNFLGTTDNQALELKAFGQRALRLEPVITVTNSGPGYTVIYSNAPNLIGGSLVNSADAGVLGSFIGGGGMGGYYLDTGAGYVFSGPFPNRISTKFATIAGGYSNTIRTVADGSAIGGGINNTVQTNSSLSTIGGGYNNTVNSSATYATIGGGSGNRAGSNNMSWATIGGGSDNISSGQNSTVGGGDANSSSGSWSTVGGGQQNTNTQFYAAIGGGTLNIASGFAATVPGGYLNTAAGTYSFAVGYRAKALHQGAFVWADSQNADFTSTVNDQFLIRAGGGVLLSDTTPSISFGTTTRQMLNFYGLGFGVGVQPGTLYARSNTRFSWFVGGVHSDLQNNPGGGALAMTLTTASLTVNGVFVSSSDRNVKAGFTAVDPKAILEKVAALPIQRWHFTNDASTPHLGPMAQDFHAAFGLGTDDKHIATVDADGVALAAIQGLNQKVENKEARITALEKELAKIKRLLLKQSKKQE